RGVPGDKLIVHRPGFNLGNELVSDVAPADRYVLFAGRFVEKKGAACLIEAMRRLEANGRDSRLVLIGEGPLEGELRRAASALGNVEFHGWMPNDELRQWMRG